MAVRATGRPEPKPEGSPRERLLESVIQHFAEHGLADQSLRHIAEAIGTSHRMLLYHFGSKDGLLLEVVRAVEARYRGSYLGILWAVLNPVLMLVIFFVVFGIIFGGHFRDPSVES